MLQCIHLEALPLEEGDVLFGSRGEGSLRVAVQIRMVLVAWRGSLDESGLGGEKLAFLHLSWVESAPGCVACPS